MIKFIRFIPTPGEKHLGIAEIIYNDVLLRYKVSPGKEGGYFIQPASHKIRENGNDSYIAAFLIDSRIMEESIKTEIRRGMKEQNALEDLSSQEILF